MKNKKQLPTLFLGIIIGICLTLSPTVFANTAQQITAQFTKLNIFVNGEQVELEQDPILVNGSTFLPLRVVADLLDYDVKYTHETRTIELDAKSKPVASNNGNEIVNNNNIEKDDEKLTENSNNVENAEIEVLDDYIPILSDIPAIRYDERIYLPLRAGGEMYGFYQHIGYNRNDSTVIIKFDNIDVTLDISESAEFDADAFFYKNSIYILEDVFKSIENNM